MMKILLLGANGQIGRELLRTLSMVGDVFPLTRRHCDFTDFRALNRILNTEQPPVVVNAAAYTAVDNAESDREMAERLNQGLPEMLSDWCEEHNALLVDFSTDYIFDGNKHEPWLETDPRAPLNVYGETKCAGLEAIEDSGCRYLVFIVTWVYATEGKNFPNTMLRLAREKQELTVVSDQIGAPTPAHWIAHQVAVCLEQVLEAPEKEGIYNLAPAGNTSWFEFAREIIGQALERGETLALTVEDIKRVPGSKFPTPARRPSYSLLDTNKLKSTFGIVTPHWRTLYRELVQAGKVSP